MELKQPGPASALSGAVARYDSRVTITQVSVRILRTSFMHAFRTREWNADLSLF